MVALALALVVVPDRGAWLLVVPTAGRLLLVVALVVVVPDQLAYRLGQA